MCWKILAGGRERGGWEKGEGEREGEMGGRNWMEGVEVGGGGRGWR